jgi:hypothetical protein
MQDACALRYAASDLRKNKNVVLIALAENSLAMNWASKDLQDGGMRRYMDDLAFARQGFTLFLLASQNYYGNNAPDQMDGAAKFRARITSEACVLTKLGAHGVFFAWKFKQLIAEFAEAPFGKSLTTLRNAVKNIDGTWGASFEDFDDEVSDTDSGNDNGFD